MTDITTTPLTPTQTEANARLIRQEALALRTQRGVAIVGCGGVGSWIAYMLALAGVPNLWLFDGDNVSDHNLNRLLLPPTAIGQPKSTALADAIRGFRPDAHLVPMGAFSPAIVDAISLTEEISCVACSTDTWSSRRMAYDWARGHGIPYVEAAAEGDIGSISDSPADFATPEEDNPGYASVPVWVGPCISAATMTCTAILRPLRTPRGGAYRFGYDRDTHTIKLLSPPTPASALTPATEARLQQLYRDITPLVTT